MVRARAAAQHGCTLWPSFQAGPARPSHGTTLTLWIVSGAEDVFFFSFFFFTGISKQTAAALAVRGPHGAGRAAVSSHDPGLTQSSRQITGHTELLREIRGREQAGTRGHPAKVLYGSLLLILRC